jgi:hypothetical protein
VADACNPSTQDTEVGGSQVQGQLGLHNKTVSKNKKQAGVVVHAYNTSYSGSRDQENNGS